MPDTKYPADTQRFDIAGIDLNRPVDGIKPNKMPYLKNMRAVQAGRLEPRLGLTDIAAVVTSKTPVHSIRRLNDPDNSTFTRIIGTQDRVAYGTTSFTNLDGAYSGSPLALVPWSPENSPLTFMYIGDSARMRKVGLSGVYHTIGLPAPDAAPAVALTIVPKYKDVDLFDNIAFGTGWTNGGIAGAIALTNSRSSFTITYILYDALTTGWCSITPGNTTGIGVGERFVFATAAETQTVEQVFAGGAQTDIGSISYDNSPTNTGLCSIVLATPYEQVAVNQIIRNLTTGPENARILAVTHGPDGTTSIRVSTSGTWVAGDDIQSQNTFRIYTANNHAAGETMTANGFSVTNTGAGVGYITRTTGVAGTPIMDLSVIDTGVPARPDDIMGFSARVSGPEDIIEIKILLDVDVAVNDFTQNYYWKSFRPADITPSEDNLQSLIANRSTIQQRAIADQSPSATIDPNPEYRGLEYDSEGNLLPIPTYVFRWNDPETQTSTQLTPGSLVWVDLKFPISDLIRVGSDLNRTLKDVCAIRVQITTNTNGDNWSVADWWIGGGFGPDAVSSPSAQPYIYRYRARNSATNVASNPSPPTRLIVLPRRQSVTVSPTQYAAVSGTSPAVGDYVLDIERLGGEISDWHYVGTIANASTPSFTDVYSDTIVAGQPQLGFDNYQPWPIIDIPKTGTLASNGGVGTIINDTATNFVATWAPGTSITVNNQPFTIYRVHSTSKIELYENVGTLGAVPWRVEEPVVLPTPTTSPGCLPCLWQYDDTFFACGDDTNPGRLYYSNHLSETTKINNYIDITSPSEPLMNGTAYNLRAYVFSSERLFQILPTGNPDAPWRAEEIPGNPGLFSRWAMTVNNPLSPYIAYLSKYGIWQTTGGPGRKISDDDLYTLFPNEGGLGTNQVTGGGVAQATFFDSFDRADAATPGSDWTQSVLCWGIVSNALQETTHVVSQSMYFNTMDVTLGDQYCQMTYGGDVTATGSGPQIMIPTTQVVSGNPQGYYLFYDTFNSVFRIGRSGTNFASTAGTLAVGDTFRLEGVNMTTFTRLTAYKNGIQVLTYDDSFGDRRTTGRAGVAKIVDLSPPSPQGDIWLDWMADSLSVVPGSATPAPNMIAAQAANLRLHWYDGALYFDYANLLGTKSTLIWFDRYEGWWFDDYTPDIQCHYGEEGAGVHALLCGGTDSTTARLYQYAGNTDNATAIQCAFDTPARDQGEPRRNKFYGDIMLDCDAMGVSIAATPYLNSYTVAGATSAVTNDGRAQTALPTSALEWDTARNIGLRVEFEVDDENRPLFWIWEPRWTFESAAISAFSWNISPTTFGMRNFKSFGMYRITHVSTANLSLIVTVDGTAQTTITISHSSGAYLTTVGRFPVYKGKLYQVFLVSGTEFRLDTRDSFFQVKEWGSTAPYQELRIFGDYAMVEG